MSNVLKLIIAYKGTHYLGWQRTKEGPSIEQALSDALEVLLKDRPQIYPTQPKTKLSVFSGIDAASRTDAGVHARGQVVHCKTTSPLPLEALQRKLNGLLPKDICVRAIYEESADFHATLSAVKKEYAYEVCHGSVQLPFHRETSWHFPHALDIEAMQKAAQAVVGKRDFSAFCNARAAWDRSPICHLERIEIFPLAPDRLRFVLIGDHFLYKMARNIVGTLVYCGAGKLPISELAHLIESKDRSRLGPTAPAHGLILEKVVYGADFAKKPSFEPFSVYDLAQ